MLRSIINGIQRLRIVATDGEIGQITHALFDDRHWTVRYLVVDTGRWLPGRRVLIAPRAVVRIDDAAGELHLDLTKGQIRDSPDVETERPVSRQQEVALHSYYGYPYYWGGAGFWAEWGHAPGAAIPAGADPAAVPPAELHGAAARGPAGEPEEGDPHLRSTDEVAGYHLEAADGSIGHIDDFILNDADWKIRYLAVDTSNLPGGRQVLVPHDWVTGVDWSTAKVRVTVTREVVGRSPGYDKSPVLSGEREKDLESELSRARR